MDRDGNPTSLRCRSCGNEPPADNGNAALRKLGRTYQVIVACGSCGTRFVVLSRN